MQFALLGIAVFKQHSGLAESLEPITAFYRVPLFCYPRTLIWFEVEPFFSKNGFEVGVNLLV
jgi:hypothetical protein